MCRILCSTVMLGCTAWQLLYLQDILFRTFWYQLLPSCLCLLVFLNESCNKSQSIAIFAAVMRLFQPSSLAEPSKIVESNPLYIYQSKHFKPKSKQAGFSLSIRFFWLNYQSGRYRHCDILELDCLVYFPETYIYTERRASKSINNISVSPSMFTRLAQMVHALLTKAFIICSYGLLFKLC